jgi:hypothetical protein
MIKCTCVKSIQLLQKKLKLVHLSEAGVTFNNSFFDNYFVLVRQLKNRSFLYSQNNINRT